MAWPLVISDMKKKKQQHKNVMKACKHEHLYDTDVKGYSIETNDTI